VGHTRGIVEEGFAGLLGRRHGEEGEAAQVGEMVASAQGAPPSGLTPFWRLGGFGCRKQHF
jgi:hypothetical protein